MLKGFKAASQFVSRSLAVLKSTGHEVMAVAVSPYEVEAKVTHKAYQGAVTACAVNEASRGVEEFAYD
jgi:hypothetical protein